MTCLLKLPLRLLFCLLLLTFSASAGLAQDGGSAASLPTDALIEALENEEARAALIEALRGAGTSAAPPAADAEPQSMAMRAAEISRTVVSEFGAGLQRVGSDLQRFALLPDLLTPERRTEIIANLLPLLLTIVATVATYRLGRSVTGRIRFERSLASGTLLARTSMFLGQVALRVGCVLVAWVAGYLAAAVSVGGGAPALSQAIYLNAFLIFGLVSTALSVFASDDPRDMTFADMAPATERVIYRSVRRVMGFLIYGLVAVAPIAQEWVNFVLARSLRTLVITLGALAAFYAIARIRKALNEEWARIVASHEGETPPRRSLWQAIWPTLAVLYVMASYGVALAAPNRMVELVGSATLMTAIGLGLFLIALRVFSNVTTPPRVKLPAALSAALPPLEDRLSGFVPAGMVILGVLLSFAALGAFLGGWGIIDLGTLQAGAGGALVSRLVTLAVGVGILVLFWSVLVTWIDTRLSEELSGKQVSSRSRTLLALFKNVVSIALIIFGGMTVLSELGVDIAPLLAGAGVLGLAIGFGAQKLVQDIITGIFIQLENAINEGDVITVAGLTGGVEKLTIRSVGLRDAAGTYHLIPFSSVDTVGNFTRRFAYHVEVVGVDYDSDLEVVKAAMFAAYEAVKDGPLGREIIAPLEYHGVVGLADSSVNLRARVKTRPGQQWAVGRAYTEQLKRALDAAGISIPYPHRELKLPKELLERLAPKAIEAP